MKTECSQINKYIKINIKRKENEIRQEKILEDNDPKSSTLMKTWKWKKSSYVKQDILPATDSTICIECLFINYLSSTFCIGQEGIYI